MALFVTRNPLINQYYEFIERRCKIYKKLDEGFESRSKIYKLFHGKEFYCINISHTTALQLSVKFLEMVNIDDDGEEIDWEMYKEHIESEIKFVTCRIFDYKNKPLLYRLLYNYEYITEYKHSVWELDELNRHYCYLKEFMRENNIKENEDTHNELFRNQ